MAVAADEPRLVVDGCPGNEGLSQILDGVEVSDPEQLLLQGADEALGAAVALGSLDEGRAPRKRTSSWNTSLMNWLP